MRSENVFAYTDTDPAAVYPEYVSINKDEAGELSITVRTATLGGLGHARLPREKIGALVDALAPYRVDPAGVRNVGTFDAPELRYSFSWALGFLKEGKRVARHDWGSATAQAWLDLIHLEGYQPFIRFTDSSNGEMFDSEVYTPNVADMLADDWCIVEDRTDEPELPLETRTTHHRQNAWECKIGGADITLPYGADAPMRAAVERAYCELTGKLPDYTFSGWGASLTDAERSVVDTAEAARNPYRHGCAPELPMFNNDGPWVAQLAAVATDTYAISSDPMRTCQTCKYGSKPSGSHEGCDECMADASRPHWTVCCGKCGACDSLKP